MLNVLRSCSKELDDWPEELRGELADAVARLERGHMLSMPLSRPMPSIGNGVHELRFRDRTGIYRCIYLLAGAGRIWLVHAFQKKTKKTPTENIRIAQQRIRGILR
jgi:phage-related protein